ncbi:winged helix-turn-helix transcriptional regulator [Halorientalis marina]|uniref:winged helix-turn-helix transcriptional regulator n=1 Tax=Halorientalis marina TaxID=2931976 RepID=UPI001FF2B01E|nr:helix-turn-helix domain-containing protein [Halorientalis marina]
MGVTLGDVGSDHGWEREIMCLGSVFFVMTTTHQPNRDDARPQAKSSERERSVPQPPDAAADQAVAALLDLLARRHTLELLYVFARDPGPWRYNDLEQALSIPQNSLTRRLADLVEADLLDRQAYAEIPPRVEYTATDQAEALKPVFTRLYEWSPSATRTEPDGTEEDS